MKETRFFYVPQAASGDELSEEEAKHAVRVLRLRAGDELYLMDGQGTFYDAELTLVSAKRCFYRVTRALPQQKRWQDVYIWP